MIFGTLIVLAATVAEAACAACPPAKCKPNVETAEHRAHIISNYFNMWGGDLDLVEQTLNPTLTFQADNFPLSTNCSSGAGARNAVIQTSEEFLGFVKAARSGFEKYAFDSEFSFGSENMVVARWTLRGIIGEHFTVLPTTFKPGDPVTYNGTEILILNKCTGLADAIYSAQDLIHFFGNLGLKAVTV